MAAFSERLRKLRESLNLSQNEFSKQLGVSRVSLTHYEAGDRTPDIDFLSRLHQCTGVSVYYLLGLTDSKDDSFATAQRDTGLSEQALETLSNSADAVQIADLYLRHADFPDMAHALMVLHDNQLIANNGYQLDNGTVVLTDLGLRNTEDLKKAICQQVFDILNSKTTPFGIQNNELPYIASYEATAFFVALRDVMDECESVFPGSTEDVKKQRAEIIHRFIRSYNGPGKEDTNGETTPDQ